MTKKLLVFSLLLFHLFTLAEPTFTDVVRYSPFADAPNQVTPVANYSVKGECIQQSLVDKRQDAWLCKVGNTVLDPCFISTSKHSPHVLCPQSPWHQNAVMIKLASTLPPSATHRVDMSQDTPWAIELSSGEQCIKVVVPGETGNKLMYHCQNKQTVFANFKRCNGQWQTTLNAQETNEQHHVTVKRAWF